MRKEKKKERLANLVWTEMKKRRLIKRRRKKKQLLKRGYVFDAPLL